MNKLLAILLILTLIPTVQAEKYNIEGSINAITLLEIHMQIQEGDKKDKFKFEDFEIEKIKSKFGEYTIKYTDNQCCIQ